MQRVDSLEKTLMLGGIGRRRRRGRQRMRWLDGITDSMDMSLSELRDGQGGLACFDSWGRKELDTTEWLNWTELKGRGKGKMRNYWLISTEFLFVWWKDFRNSSDRCMATLSSILAWRIPGTVEPGGLPSMGLHRIRHDWSDLAAAGHGINLNVQQLRNG